MLPLAQANGLVAQLAERRNGIAEVVSSNLIGSTILRRSAAEVKDALRRLGKGGHFTRQRVFTNPGFSRRQGYG